MGKRSKNWPEKRRIEAVTTYLALGKLPFVAQVIGVPYETLRAWKKSDWWEDLESQIRTEENQELDTKLSKIVNKSLDVVVDRLEHGDFFMDKAGKVHRVPVKMKEASRVSSELLDKRSLLRKEPTRKEQIKQETVNERLLSLAEQFAAIALGKDPRKTEKIIEGEVIGEIQNEEYSPDLQTMQQTVTAEGFYASGSSEQNLHKNDMQNLLCWESKNQSPG